MRGVLLDMDGVLYNSDEPIAGATEAVAWLRAAGIPHVFVTNTTSRGRIALVETLTRFGIPADENRILTPCVAAAQWLRERQDGKAALFVAPKAMVEFEGLDVVAEDAESGARYIVVGDLGQKWDFPTLNRAFRLLQSDPEAILIGLGMTRFWHAPDGLRLDAGPFITALQYATGRKALVFGKPATAFFNAAVQQLAVPHGEIVMVGDDIQTDIAGAQNAGLKGVIVKTGKFRPLDLEGPTTPDDVLASIADLPGWLVARN